MVLFPDPDLPSNKIIPGYKITCFDSHFWKFNNFISMNDSNSEILRKVFLLKFQCQT